MSSELLKNSIKSNRLCWKYLSLLCDYGILLSWKWHALHSNRLKTCNTCCMWYHQFQNSYTHVIYKTYTNLFKKQNRNKYIFNSTSCPLLNAKFHDPFPHQVLNTTILCFIQNHKKSPAKQKKKKMFSRRILLYISYVPTLVTEKAMYAIETNKVSLNCVV